MPGACRGVRDVEGEPVSESYLGRGLDPTPGKGLGYAWHRERNEIRAHLRRRVWRFGLDNLAAFRLEQRVDAIQRRIHRNKPTFRERSAAFAARQPVARREAFTPEELARIAEHFAGANDPIGQSILAKAST